MVRSSSNLVMVSDIAVDRDYTVLLSDWSDQNPEHLFATLNVKATISTSTSAPSAISLRTLERTVGAPLSPIGACGARCE